MSVKRRLAAAGLPVAGVTVFAALALTGPASAAAVDSSALAARQGAPAGIAATCEPGQRTKCGYASPDGYDNADDDNGDGDTGVDGDTGTDDSGDDTGSGAGAGDDDGRGNGDGYGGESRARPRPRAPRPAVAPTMCPPVAKARRPPLPVAPDRTPCRTATAAPCR